MMEQKEQNNRETSEQDISLLVEEDGFEPSKLTQQIYSLPPLATRELLQMKTWSWWTDLNPRPADYKSAALPTELHQRITLIYYSIQLENCQRVFINFLKFIQNQLKHLLFPAIIAFFAIYFKYLHNIYYNFFTHLHINHLPSSISCLVNEYYLRREGR